MGERLRQARKGLHISAGFVVKATGMDINDILDIESGIREASDLELLLFSRIYGVSVNYLKNGADIYTQNDMELIAGLHPHDRREIWNLLEYRRKLRIRKTA